jgi:hypothetical protein
MIFQYDIQPIYFLLPVIGFVIGLFGSVLGGGGGFFFLPILSLVFNVPAQMAVTTSLVATLPICITGTISHYQKNNVNIRIAGMFALSGIIGSVIGCRILHWMSTYQVRIMFGIYSVLMAAHIAFNSWKDKKNNQPDDISGQSVGSFQRIKSLSFGSMAGIITGSLGTSGTAPVLAGLFSIRMPFKMVIGTSLLIVLVNTAVTVGIHLVTSKIDMTLVGLLTIGSVVGAFAGPKILSGLKVGQNETKLKYYYAFVIFAIGLLMIIKSLHI